MLTSLSEQLPFEFAKNAPSSLCVVRIVSSVIRPHAIDITVQVMCRNSKVAEEIVTIGDDVAHALHLVERTVIRTFETKGYLVKNIKGLRRQLSRYNKVQAKRV